MVPVTCANNGTNYEDHRSSEPFHSSGELGIQLATMLHLGPVVPNLTFAADAHYHHLVDDVIAGGKLTYCHGAIAVPHMPGLGVKLDRDRLAEYH